MRIRIRKNPTQCCCCADVYIRYWETVRILNMKAQLWRHKELREMSKAAVLPTSTAISICRGNLEPNREPVIFCKRQNWSFEMISHDKISLVEHHKGEATSSPVVTVSSDTQKSQDYCAVAVELQKLSYMELVSQ
ncbi:hypothetical protein EVAR_76096_1 [Eumeta japonica]|uniref:Uncharacterized protein n=1 Tax=Eumeta variegata TaxID=151549 RepID=A0A4C1W4I1_EUMVA|nr:hypothetical protein EVAR_76096_1 [Eumeta japonica]